MFNFVFDREHLGRPYPNLAPMMDASNGYHGMGNDYPWIVPLRLWYYVQDHNYPFSVNYIDQPMPPNAFYPVGIGWFDFSQDYFAMMSDRVRDLLREHKLTVLFYYHEGDSPYHEKVRLDQLCEQNQLPKDCYRFISGNSAADNVDNFVYFVDHELFYWRNAVVWNKQIMPGCNAHLNLRNRDFTLLSRIHKWWRASIIAHLRNQHILDNSFWSYNILDQGDRWEDNPIMINVIPNLEQDIREFVRHAPYRCDEQTEVEHNRHWTLVKEHFEDSYCNIVLETFYDAEQSLGTFLSEKIFKPIRHGQPFVPFGTPRSLKVLRDLGYRCFDHVIDNNYDNIDDNTQRFLATVDVVKKIKNQDLHAWYTQCYDDCVHNQKLFVSPKYDRLNNLYDKLTYQLATS